MFLGGAIERFAHRDNFARRFAAGDGPGVRGAHHYSFEHGLPSDQRLLPTLEGWKKLDGGEESQVIS
jgi:hypothetical protein